VLWLLVGVDALLDDLERLLDLPMRNGGSDCCRRLLLDPSILIHSHKLYSLFLALRVGYKLPESAGFRIKSRTVSKVC
jgi:hypothetical protein